MTGYPLVCFDVVSAFPHAAENSENIYMEAPEELDRTEFGFAAEDDIVLWMHQSLYGRRTAGANFRDLFEEVMLAAPPGDFQLGMSEPCAYHSKASDTRATHHIDDGRALGPAEALDTLIIHLATSMLFKVSDRITPGVAVSHLGRLKIRTDSSWITVPDKKHLENVFKCVGFDSEPPKDVPTPGAKRPASDTSGDGPCDYHKEYMSAVGSLIFFAGDVEIITFPVKELARAIHGSTWNDWWDLKRLAAWLYHRADNVTSNSVD